VLIIVENVACLFPVSELQQAELTRTERRVATLIAMMISQLDSSTNARGRAVTGAHVGGKTIGEGGPFCFMGVYLDPADHGG